MPEEPPAGQAIGSGFQEMSAPPIAASTPGVVVRGLRVAGEEIGGSHDHPGGAEPALETVLLPEGLLERVQRTLRGLHPLDRGHGCAVGLDGQHRAALDRPAIEVDRAGSALARVAADVRAGQLQILTKELDEHSSWLDVPLPWLTVDDERDVLAHLRSLLS